MKDNTAIKVVSLLLSISLVGLLFSSPSVIGGQDRFPIADFSFSPSSPSTEETIHLTNKTSTPDGFVVDYTWTFGDGAKSSKENPKHSYSKPGTYTVNLTVTDNNGNTDTCTKNITVSNVSPSPDFSYYSSSPAGNVIQFEDESTDVDGDIVSWRWEFGDGGFSTVQNPSHRYEEDGVYTVTLTVTDKSGDSVTKSENITVSNVSPDVDFSYFYSSPSGGIVQFKDESVDVDGDIVSRVWMFGDGTSSTVRNPSHRYEESGTYTVTLTVTDESGATVTKSERVEVSSIKPPRILAVEAGKDEVSRRNDDLNISFQIYDESGIKNIEKTEIWIKNENSRTENYGYWPGGTLQVIKNLSPYENTYSYTFDPKDSFSPGEASVIIKSTNIYGLESTKRIENLFRVVGGDAEVETENATDLRSGEATLNASIEYGDYSDVDITFYYREKGEEEWKNTDWKTDCTSEDYSYELTDLKRETVYEFRAGIKYGDPKNRYDNGKILSFHENLGVMLIQSEIVETVKGESTVVSLEIANLMSKSIEAVRVIPPQGYKITPSVRWIGSMEVDSYLPADFRLQTQNIQDGENLTFYAIYRSEDETYKSAPLNISVGLKEPSRSLKPSFVVLPIVVIIIVIVGVYYWRWR